MVRAMKLKLKHEAGALERRPSQVLFGGWIAAAAAGQRLATTPVFPLKYFEVDDVKQIAALYALLRRHPPTLRHWLTEHVFPRTMQYQREKLSACGQALGGDMLFQTRASSPYFVPGLPHVILIELRQALRSYQDYHVLSLALAGTSSRWTAPTGWIRAASTSASTRRTRSCRKATRGATSAWRCRWRRRCSTR